jgi:hypothetical protein
MKDKDLKSEIETYPVPPSIPPQAGGCPSAMKDKDLKSEIETKTKPTG